MNILQQLAQASKGKAKFTTRNDSIKGCKTEWRYFNISKTHGRILLALVR